MAGTFRVFVSSTFDDLAAERDVLQRGLDRHGRTVEGAFARLRRLCESRGARFQAVDLRWGVSDEAALDQRTMPLCLGEVARCQRLSPRPSFVVLLGDRYGWRPLPWALAIDVFDATVARARGDDAELLTTWYRRDDNAVPPVAILQPRRGAHRDARAWQDVEDRLRRVLEPVVGPAVSATEQEIRAGLAGANDAESSVFAFVRSIEGLPSGQAAASFVDLVGDERDAAASDAIAALRSMLHDRLPGRVKEYRARWLDGRVSDDHLVQLNEDVYESLAAVITAELDRLEQLDPVAAEAAAHERFAAERAEHLVGRADVLERIAAVRQATAWRPLVLWGRAGCGKSAVVAEAARRGADENPHAVVIRRFVGATPASTVGRDLLRGMWDEIHRAYGPQEGHGPPGDDAALLAGFGAQLARATAERPLLVFVDALDQLAEHDPARDLTWLPMVLQPNTWVAVSTRPGTILDRLRARLEPEQLVEIPGLDPSDGGALLDHWLLRIGRTLQPAQREAVLSAFASSGGLPLHLRLAFEEVRDMPSWARPEPLPGDVPALVGALFDRLALEENHGHMLVSHALGLLAAARNGLTEDELLDVLAADPDVMADFARRSPRSPATGRLPVVVWSRLFADLEPYLTARRADGTVTIGFYHRELDEAAARSFLSGADGRARHALLADHFERQPLDVAHDGARLPDLRRLAELPFQQARAGRLAAVAATLTSFDFVAAKVLASGPASVIDDMDEALRQGCTDTSLAIAREALALSVGPLTADPWQLPGQLIGRLMRVDDAGVSALLKEAHASHGAAWLRPLTASLSPPGRALVRILHGQPDFTTAVALSPDGRLGASGSYQRDVRVWDLERGIEVGHFVGRPPGGPAEGGGGDAIAALRFSGSTLVAASADRCVYAIDVATGEGRTVVNGLTDALYAMAVSADGSRVAAGPRSIWGFTDYQLEVWDAVSGAQLTGLAGQSTEHLTAAMCPDGSVAASATVAGTVGVWDVASGDLLSHAEEGKVTCLALSGRRGRLAVGRQDGSILIRHRCTEPSSTVVCTGHAGEVRAVAFAGDDLLASASSDGSVRLWDATTGNELRCLRGHGRPVRSVAISPDARWLLSGAEDGAVHAWDLAREAVPSVGLPVAAHLGEVVAAAVGDAGRIVATAGADGGVLRWDALAGVGSPSDAGAGTLDEVAGRRPQAAALRAKVEQLDAALPESQASNRHTLTAVAISDDGRWALSSSIDRTTLLFRLGWDEEASDVRLWDLASGAVARVIAHRRVGLVHGGSVQAYRCVALSADGRLAAVGSDDQVVRLWDLAADEVIAAFTGESAITACALSLDGRLLIAGEATGRVHLLRLEEPARDVRPKAVVGGSRTPGSWHCSTACEAGGTRRRPSRPSPRPSTNPMPDQPSTSW